MAVMPAAVALKRSTNLLTKGGFESMMYTVSLVICAMMFGGIMEKTNQVRVVVSVILKKAQSTGSLITATVLTAIGANLILWWNSTWPSC